MSLIQSAVVSLMVVVVGGGVVLRKKGVEDGVLEWLNSNIFYCSKYIS